MKYPIFFPDATRAVVKTLDSTDIGSTKTEGILVNTYHLYRDLGRTFFKKRSVAEFMKWDGHIVSDSGGFQVMSIAKKQSRKNAVTNAGVRFKTDKGKTILFTPKMSIDFQFLLGTDLMVVLDDFTPPGASYNEAKDTVERTILWAEKCKRVYGKNLKNHKGKKRPLLIGVVQGGEYLDLRRKCTRALAEIGFDGFGYGGWPIDSKGNFNYEVAKIIADEAPDNYLLYGLGIGKPEEIRGCVSLGYHIFDCVLPTRDARHKRLYVYDAKSIDDINVRAQKFYSYYVPNKQKYFKDDRPVSTACDCLLCTNYSRAYFAHLWRIKESSALRLATIHNLRFYSLLMEKLGEELHPSS